MSLLAHSGRLLQLWRVAAYRRLDLHLAPALSGLRLLIRLHPSGLGRGFDPLGVKHACEDMGTLFVKLGQLFSTRSDLLPPEVIAQLALLQDQVKPFDVAQVKQTIADPILGLGVPVQTLFERFDETPLASASIAQVHGACLEGQEVVVKVVRPDIEAGIVQDFEALRALARFLSARLAAARAVHVIEIVEDYRQVILGELDLTFEARNATKMRKHFLGSPMMYVPKVHRAARRVMVSERIYGVPISDHQNFERLGYDKAYLAQTGLRIFFTQVFRHNFFHADMHAGNIYVETAADGSAVSAPRYMGLDCAIMGELSYADQLVVARMLLAVMNERFDELVGIIAAAGWVPPTTDRHALSRDMARTVAPMVSRPMSEIDFAGVLMQVLAIARRHQMSIPPKLVLLLKTLVHVEGLGRDLYPDLDIWSLARPILTDWLEEQLSPKTHAKHLKKALPQALLGSTQIPQLLLNALQSNALMGGRQEVLTKELQSLRQDFLLQKRHDWLAGFGLLVCAILALKAPNFWASLAILLAAALVVGWRILQE